MKTNKFKLLTLAVIVLASFAAVAAQCSDESPFERIEANAARIYGASDVVFAPSGKSMIVQLDRDFYLFPAADFEPAADPAAPRVFDCWEGRAKGFLPSGKIVYAARRGLYAIDPATKKTSPIYQITAAEEEDGDYLIDGEMVFVSENLIVSGDGDYDLGMKKGNILRFDVGRRRAARRASIDGFQNPRLSPGGKYILYEHNGENGGRADYYDLAADRNHPLAARFDFKRVFPRYRRTFERPIAWISPHRFLVQVDADRSASGAEDAARGAEPWLVLGDAETGKIIWKRRAQAELLPPYFHRLSATKALAETGGEIYEIALADGRWKRIMPDFKGHSIALSPDRRRIAYFEDCRLYVAALDGENGRAVLELPADWKSVPAYKAEGATPPIWSPDGRRLIVIDGKRALFVRL